MPFRLRHDERIERLRQVSFLSELTTADLGTIAEVVVERDVPAGTAITREGHAGGTAYVLVAGEAVVSKDGRELARLGPGQVVGELSLLDRGVRSATVTASNDLQVLAVSADDFHALLEKVPRLALELLAVLAGRIRTLDGQVVESP